MSKLGHSPISFTAFAKTTSDVLFSWTVIVGTLATWLHVDIYSTTS